MNFSVVLYLLGKMFMVCAVSLVFPLAVSVYYGDDCYTAFLTTGVLAAFAGLMLCTYGNPDESGTFTFREGVSLVTNTWCFLAVLGALPYFLSGWTDLPTAFFESVSGFTATGGTALPDVGRLPNSLLFWRQLTHWMGGIGVVVWFIAFLPNLGAGAVHMYNAEVAGATDDKAMPRIRETTIMLCKIYVGLTAVETACLYFAGMGLFNSLCHAFTTIATGGFSPQDASVAAFSSPLIEGIICFFMFIAGGNFALYYAGWKKGWSVLWHDTEYRTYVCILLTAYALVIINLATATDYSIWEAIRYGVFQVTTICTTTALISADYDLWPAFSRIVLVGLMFLGACAGSTCGGIKISRFIILFKSVGAEIKHILHPSMVFSIKMNGAKVAPSVVKGVSGYFFLVIFLVAFFSLIMATTGLNIEEAISASIACLNNIGPGLGRLGATGNYSIIPAYGKFVLCVAMILGRLEFFTVLVMLRPEFWRGTRRW